jgi:hypothetical protein
MTEKWRVFEKNSTKYLNKTISLDGITFVQKGESNSKESDIVAEFNGKIISVIEAKLSPAQSGQFVVLLNETGQYEYSTLNTNEENEYSKKITDFLNSDPKFRKCGSKGIKLNLTTEILANWIMAHYKKKNVEFIITSDKPSDFKNNFIQIFPIGMYSSFFEITAVLRCKKSGSQRIPQKDLEGVEKLLLSRFGHSFSLSKNGEVKFDKISPNKTYLNKKFFLSLKEDVYSVRKLSSTNNPNIIFSVKFKGKKQTTGVDFLRKSITHKLKSLKF